MKCRECGVELTIDNSYPSSIRKHNHICNDCMKAQVREHPETRRLYRLKFMRKKHVGYGGVCICPKCGRKGYKNYRRWLNLKTGSENTYTVVYHKHQENGKCVYDPPHCYIGTGRL